MDDWLAGGDRRELAVRALHDAAREQLVERGLDRFSVEAVAARAGCSRATLYRLVGGKKALLDAVLGEAAAAMARRITAGIEGLEGEERVVEAILTALAEIRADPTVSEWVRRTALGEGHLEGSADLAQVASAVTGASAAGDWVLRVVLSLVVWPVPDRALEQDLVRRYVGPAFR